MTRKSRFAGLADALKEKAKPQASPGKSKLAKSKDKANYAQTTVYLHRKRVHTPLQSALAEAQLEYSQLVEDLLSEWLDKRADT